VLALAACALSLPGVAGAQPEEPAEVRPFEVLGRPVDPGVRLHFDQNLPELAEQSALPHCVSWRIVDFVSMNTGDPSADPWVILDADPESCPPPAGAHADVQLEIWYEDVNGALQHYEGLESAFDWSPVREVTSCERNGMRVLHAENASYEGLNGGGSSNNAADYGFMSTR